jgi:hypothetical protein
MESKIYEFEQFVPYDVCNTIVDWFKEQPKISENGAQQLFNGRTIDFRNIPNYDIKKLVNKFKFDATKLAMSIFDEEHLYPDYTDLVLWEAGSGMLVHADNCDAEGNPNYVHWRDYSGVVYLNDDFVGGETWFPDHGPKFVKPRKGKFVLYPSTLEYAHGVTTVVGTRYTMPIWFTKNSNYIEA